MSDRPLHHPTDEDREALEILSLRDDLTEWEEHFIESLSERDVWTEKQRKIFDELFDRKGDGLVRKGDT